MDSSGELGRIDQAAAAGHQAREFSTNQHGPGNRESRYQPLVVIAIAVVAGIVLDRYVGQTLISNVDANFAAGLSMASWWYLAICLLCGWWLAWSRQRNAVAAWILIAAVTMTAGAWHDARWFLYSHFDLLRYAPINAWTPVCLEAVALEAPEQLAAPKSTPLQSIPIGDRSRLRVGARAIRDGTVWRPAAGDCEVVTGGHLLGVRAGDRLRLFGQLGRAAPPRNPGEFDFADHARADRFLVRVRSTAPDSVSVIGDFHHWSWHRALDDLRRSCQRNLRRYVGPERSGLASAILLGAREELPRQETAAYLATGTVHLLVVSGLNVGILAAGLYFAMRLGWLSRRTGLAVIIAVVIAYTLLTRCEPPVLRAALLAVFMCIADWTGRRGAAFNSLAAAALVVLAINPAELFRVGTQLSFLCVAALIWIGFNYPAARQTSGDRLDQLLAAVQPWHVRWSSKIGSWTFWLLLTTLVVWLVSLPLVLYQFHIISPIAVPISPPVWLLVFVAMWSGFFLLLFGWMWSPLATLLGAICNYSLAGLETVVEWAEELPAGHSWWPGPAWWWVVGFYVGLLAVMIWNGAHVKPRWQVAALAAWILVGLVPPLKHALARDHLGIAFLSVGHGTCVLVDSPTGETILYDAGSLGTPDFATQTISSYLWHRGIRRIDGIILSHADIDHYNAVPGLMERFDVGAIYVSPIMFSRFSGGDSEGPAVLRDAIEHAKVPLREIWSGDRLHVGSEVKVEVLHPPRRGVLGTDNANSITVAIEYGERRLVLPGDLEPPGLEDLIAELPYDCDVLLAPHHGSRSSDPPGFAAWSTPDWVVISGAGGEQVTPVIQAYERAGANVLETQALGTIEITLEPKATRVATWRTPHPVRRNNGL